MEDKEFFSRLLGLPRPWRVVKVELGQELRCVNLWVAADPAWEWRCPVCDRPAPILDHLENQTWRHLDTCQHATILHAQFVWIRCPEHGVKRAPTAWVWPTPPPSERQ
jgi:transposase